jgi:hypothetical protein
LPCESWLEARWLQLLDHDPDVVALRTQPMTIAGEDMDGEFSHTPDILAVLRDGSARLIDVKTPDHLGRPDVLRLSRLAHVAADGLGWSYYLVGEPPEERERTVSWLAGFRRAQRCQGLHEELVRRAADPIRLRTLWAQFGDGDVQVRPATYHLLWHHRLLMDFNTQLRESTRVWAAPGDDDEEG